MCGVVGYAGGGAAAARLLEALAFLQHRGQDSAGIATTDGGRIFMHKGKGLANSVFKESRLQSLPGGVGVGHVRYPTSGAARAVSEIQPMYAGQPYGLALAHNGNLVNASALRHRLENGEDRRHINSDSDSETLLNLLAARMSQRAGRRPFSPEIFFEAAADLAEECRGAYALVAAVAGHGLLAMRDPLGIRPLALGVKKGGGDDGGDEWLAASESVAFSALGFEFVGDLQPGEAVFISADGELTRRQCAPNARLLPCLFEYVYLARPDSVLDGALVYEARRNMGRKLAEKILREHPNLGADSVMPVPDSARPAAIEAALRLGLPYREGLVKNLYVGRTFIMSGQSRRQLGVREKLHAIAPEFKDKSVLLVDDSVVRGTTSAEIVRVAREAGARRVFLASASPAVRHQNVYGIDMPTREELVANGRDEETIARQLGVDAVIYQSLDDLKDAVREAGAVAADFESSCFDGVYATGGVSRAHLEEVSATRGGDRDEPAAAAG